MEMTFKYSAEMKNGLWRSFELALDEIDLKRVMNSAELELPLDEIPAALAFQTLEAEAQRLMYFELGQKFEYPVEDVIGQDIDGNDVVLQKGAKTMITESILQQKAALQKIKNIEPRKKSDPPWEE